MSYYTERQWLFYEDIPYPYVHFRGWVFVAASILFLFPTTVG